MKKSKKIFYDEEHKPTIVKEELADHESTLYTSSRQT